MAETPLTVTLDTDAVADKVTGRLAPALSEAILTEAYWKLREHASGYRSAKAAREAIAAWHADRDDREKREKAAVHEWYARGIEAAARTIAELLDVPEHEIEPIAEATDECADAVMGLFRSVREDYEDTYWTTLADQRDQISRQRFIVADMARETEPERIEGAWRG